MANQVKFQWYNRMSLLRQTSKKKCYTDIRVDEIKEIMMKDNTALLEISGMNNSKKTNFDSN